MAAPEWSAAYVPPIFGFLDPPPAWAHPTHIPSLRDAFGQVLHPVNGTVIRDFRFLPQQLPERIEPWEIEWYFRQSYQLTYNDLRARQPPELGPLTSKQKNALNNQRHRQGRLPYNSRSWSNKYHGRPTKVLLELVDNLSRHQIDWNTTWTWIPGGGWHQPLNPANTVPIDYFLISNAWPHVPSQEVSDAQLTLTNLRAIAAQQGLRSWKDLPKDLLPSDWGMRVSGTRANDPNGAIAHAAVQAGLTTATNRASLLIPPVQTTRYTSISGSSTIPQGILQGPRIKDDPDRDMITDGTKIEDEEKNDTAANTGHEVDDKAIDDANNMRDDGEGLDYDADDELEVETEEENRLGGKIAGGDGEMDSTMDDVDDNGSSTDDDEDRNEHDLNISTDKGQPSSKSTRQCHGQGITNHNDSGESKTFDRKTATKTIGGQETLNDAESSSDPDIDNGQQEQAYSYQNFSNCCSEPELPNDGPHGGRQTLSKMEDEEMIAFEKLHSGGRTI